MKGKGHMGSSMDKQCIHQKDEIKRQAWMGLDKQCIHQTDEIKDKKCIHQTDKKKVVRRELDNMCIHQTWTWALTQHQRAH